MVEVGSRVGLLTVTEPTEQRKGGYIVWRCRCACGGEILLDTRSIKRGTVRDCGCQTMVRPGQRDISGERFGKLTALRPTSKRSRNGSTMWLCRCDCGNKLQVDLGQLMAGSRKSCGCLGHPQRKDFIGKRFGRLFVTAYEGKWAGMHRWRCICDCGNETVVGQTLLQTGKTKSCGCLQAMVGRENLELREGTSVTRLRAIKNGCLIRTNTSGYNGVYFNKKSGRWIAQITFQGTTRYLGSFDLLVDAVKARQRGEEIYDMFLESLDEEETVSGEKDEK